MIKNFFTTLNFSRLRSLGIRGSLAIIDQAVFSGSNFILNILLARWLLPTDYGAFSVAFSFFLFLSGFHNAILLEPMSVIGPANYAGRMAVYLDRQIHLHFRFSLPVGLLTAAAGAILLAAKLGDQWLAAALVGAGLSLPFILFLWVARRMFYVVQRPAGALLSSCMYSVLLFSGLGLAHALHVTSSAMGFGLMGAASLLSSIVILLWGKISSSKSSKEPHLREVWNAHWDFGKWAMIAAILSIASGQAQIFFTAGMINLEAAGVLRAMQNFMLPMAQIVTALSLLGLPSLSYDFGRGNLRSLRRKGFFLMIILTGLSIVYELITWRFAAPLEHLIYGGKYAAYTGLIAPLGLIPIITALATGFSIILRSIQKPKSYLISGIVTGVVGLASSILFTRLWGISGAVASIVLSYFASFVVAAYLYQLWFPHGPVEVAIAQGKGS
jgi:O-antigen/teichoic acid export membrane protein